MQRKIKTYTAGDQLERHSPEAVITPGDKAFSLLFWKINELDLTASKRSGAQRRVSNMYTADNCIYLGQVILRDNKRRKPFLLGAVSMGALENTLNEVGLSLEQDIQGWEDFDPEVVRKQLPENPARRGVLLPMRAHLKSIGVIPAEGNLSL